LFLSLFIISVSVCVCTVDKEIEAAEENWKADESSTQTNTGTGSGMAEHLAIGSQFTFCINLLQASGISAEYCDVYCQFRYALRTIHKQDSGRH